jgi:excisionase family DNA binding protein
MFQMPRKTVENLARAGTLPGFKIGRAWRFRLAALERWQREREAAQSVPDDWS